MQANLNLIPKPQALFPMEGIFVLHHIDAILIDEMFSDPDFSSGARFAATLLQEEIKNDLGFTLPITPLSDEDATVFIMKNTGLKGDEYTVIITEEGIAVEASTKAGILYGVQTLRQLIRLNGAILPCLTLRDKPEFNHRGYMLDTTRSRIIKKDEIKRIIEMMSFYKMNELHLYVEHAFMFPELSEVWRDDTPITPEDIMELDAYASKFSVELVPCLASFGHMYKVLRTKTYKDLCEFPEQCEEPFSFIDRMAHHTLTPSDERSLDLSLQLISQYACLFKSKKFNFCCDETFDLGKGQSKALAESKGVDRLYLDYVKSIAEFLVSIGRTPMFWGDIIAEHPEHMKELPEGTICLNWGYDVDVEDTRAKAFHEVGAIQYMCPGVNGWNNFIPRIDTAYKNIKLMCDYAVKYEAEGILTTDWGDFGHINDPRFSFPAVIIGAAFSWNKEEISEEEILSMIEVMELGKDLNVLKSLSEMKNQGFNWFKAVSYKEDRFDIKLHKETRPSMDELFLIDEARFKIYQALLEVKESKKEMLSDLLIALDGESLLREVCITLNADYKEREELAKRFEKWFVRFTKMYRKVSEEGELYHTREVIEFYADLLRLS